MLSPLQQLIAFVRARELDPRLAYWLHCQPDLDRAWAKMPRVDWLLLIAIELGVHPGVINAAQTDADLVASVDARGTHLTVTELRCNAIRRHVTAQHVVELLLRLPAAGGRQEATGERVRPTLRLAGRPPTGMSGQSGVRKLGGNGR